MDEPSTPSPLKVRAHPSLCEGWGNCHRWAPDVYPLDDDGQIAIHLLEVPAELAESAWIGAQVCPARAITVIGGRPPSEQEEMP
jgi:ferredoxin